MQDSLPADGLRLCRAGVEPAGSLREVSVSIHGILLSRAYPGAITATDLKGVDASDGSRDGSVSLRSVLSLPNSWKLVGTAGAPAGDRVSSLGTWTETALGSSTYPLAPPPVDRGISCRGRIYLAPMRPMGRPVVSCPLNNVAGQPRSWRLTGVLGGGVPGTAHPADLDGDGVVEIATSITGPQSGDSTGVISINSASSLATIDALDGAIDGNISPTNRERQARWRFLGEGRLHRVIRVLAGTAGNLAALDMADGTADGTITLSSIATGVNRRIQV